jgi:hypothetical protein
MLRNNSGFENSKRLTGWVSLFEFLRNGLSGPLRLGWGYFFFGAAFVPLLPPVAGLETERRVAASLALNG